MTNQPADARQSSTVGAAATPSHDDARTPRVLVVDDSPTILRLVAQVLSNAKYSVVTATNGADALRCVQGGMASIVVSDWVMPEMTGLELCRAIRKEFGGSLIYFIVLTATASNERLVEAFDAGADDFVAKPFEQSELLARVSAGMRVVRLEADLARRTKELEAANTGLQRAHHTTQRVLESVPSALVTLDAGNCVAGWNQSAERLLRLNAEVARGRRLDDLELSWDATAIIDALTGRSSTSQIGTLHDVGFTRPDGTPGFLDVTVTPMDAADARDLTCLLTATDITERRALQNQLAQAQKLESIGQLAAGIAHEINTPTQFVSDNTRFLRSAFPRLAELLAQHRQLVQACRASTVSQALLDEIESALTKSRLDYMLEQIPEALTDSLEGLERVTEIVRAMKDFAHPGQQTMSPADLNKAIESTVTVARNEWKYVAELKLDLDPALPPVPCLLADFNQAILNVIVNAAHAIKDATGEASAAKGLITVSTRLDGAHVEIRVSDTGTGIAPEHRDRVFEQFFTTKEVGKGTGQGLAIARRTIVEKHNGALTFESEVGRGSTFIIRLPAASDNPTERESQDHDFARSAG